MAESAYNTIILDVVILREPTKEIFENIETLGHLLSASGVTLLVLPFLYFLSKRSKYRRPVFMLLSSLAVFLTVYFSLNLIMEFIVKKNVSQRYPAYYLNVLKSGIANDILGYGDILRFDHSSREFSVEEKVVLGNIFLLMHLKNKEVIDKISTTGIDNLIDFYYSKHHKTQFNEQNKQFMNLAGRLKVMYESYQEAQLSANKKYLSLSKDSHKDFLALKSSVKKKYLNYVSKISERDKDIDRRIYSIKNGDFGVQWEDFEKNYQKGGRHRQAALDGYHSRIVNEFGYFIPHQKWCEQDSDIKGFAVAIIGGFFGRGNKNGLGLNCLNDFAVKKIVTDHFKLIWEKKTDLPFSGIQGFDGFANLQSVKKEVISELHKNGIMVSASFSYSEKDYKKAYLKNLQKKTLASLQEVWKKNGLSGIKNELSFEKFVLSNEVKAIIKKEGTVYDDQEFLKVMKLIATNRTDRFHSEIFSPGLRHSLREDFALSKKDLHTFAAQKGDDALKALYVPPIATMLSLVFGFLNAISLIALAIALLAMAVFGASEKRALLLKKGVVAFAVILIIFLPAFSGKNYMDGFSSVKKSLSEHENGWVRNYFNILIWVLASEKYNYSIGVFLREKLSDSMLDRHGIEK
jgi:hypothetical protein